MFLLKTTPPRCHRCTDFIEDETYCNVPALGKHFHNKCLACTTCSVSLLKQPFYTDDNSDGIYCRPHFEEVATRCAGCELFITENTVHALGKAYHRKCFVCLECQLPPRKVDGGQLFAHPNENCGYAYCENHVPESASCSFPRPAPPPKELPDELFEESALEDEVGSPQGEIS